MDTCLSDPQPDTRAVGLKAASASLCTLVLWDGPTEDLEEANARNREAGFTVMPHW